MWFLFSIGGVTILLIVFLKNKSLSFFGTVVLIMFLIPNLAINSQDPSNFPEVEAESIAIYNIEYENLDHFKGTT